MIRTKPKIRWQEAINCYLIDRCDLAQSTLSIYRFHLDQFFATAPAELRQIGRLHILKFLQQFEPKTYNNNLAAIKSFFLWASEFYGFPDPALPLKRKKETTLTVVRVLTEPEYRIIQGFNASRKHQQKKDIAVFICNTGLRVTEFVSVRPEHIQNNVLHVLGKGAKPRDIPLNRTCQEILSRYEVNPINFRKSKYLSIYNVRYALEMLGRLLNLPYINPHCLRHFFATYLLSKGADIKSVSTLLGHASIKTTLDFYYHPTDLDSAVELLDRPAECGHGTTR